MLRNNNRPYVRRCVGADDATMTTTRRDAIATTRECHVKQMADSFLSCHVEALPFLAALLSGLYLLVSMRLTEEGGLAIKAFDSYIRY